MRSIAPEASAVTKWCSRARQDRRCARVCSTALLSFSNNVTTRARLALGFSRALPIIVRVLDRRQFLGSLCSAAVAVPAAAAGDSNEAARSGVDQDLRWVEARVEGRDGMARQALILAPAQGRPEQRYPALLLFHGRGEADDPQAGMHAWRTPYGLATAYAQLSRAPLVPDVERSRFMSRAQLAAIQTRLAEQPFGGLVLICPVTPRPRAGVQQERSLGDYADWIESALLPRVAALTPMASMPCLGVDGCSMGGQVAAAVYARKPHLFRTFGLVQPALDRAQLQGLAERLASAAQRGELAGIHLETSSEDPYRQRTEDLSSRLRQLGSRHSLDVLAGPHTQRWLRAAGTLTMLAWHDRMLHQA
jgi:iron(III)-salmochelin esterase